MKTNMYVLVALFATLFFASCSKETSSDPQPKGKTAQLELIIKGTPQANNRATDTALPGKETESKINRVVVAIFVGENVNVLKEYEVASQADLAKFKFECSPGVDCTGMVVANAAQGYFDSDVTTKTAFLQKTLALKDVQTPDNLPMSGDIKSGDVTTFTLIAGQTATLSAQISRIVARVAISNIKADFTEGAYKGATFTLKKIFMHNAKATSTIAATTTAGKISGETGTENAYLRSELDAALTTPAYTTPHWFYTFSDGTDKNTKLILWGEFTPAGGTMKNVYYPIVVNKTGMDTSQHDGIIKRNTQYNIMVVIKGIGVDGVDETIEPATIELSVSVADWEVEIPQNVEFN